MESVSSIAVWSSRIAVAGLVLFVLGPILAQIGAPPELGFRIFGLGGVLLAFIAVILGAVGLWATRASSGRGGRGQARTGALLGILLLGTTLTAAAVSSLAKGGAAAISVGADSSSCNVMMPFTNSIMASVFREMIPRLWL